MRSGSSYIDLRISAELYSLLLFCSLFKTDRPNPPSNLTLLYLDHFNISWIPPFTLSGVTLSYFVNVTNLNTHQVFSSGELSKPSFNFNGTEDNSPCDVYQFTVTARNAAGWSGPSDTFDASTPSRKFLNSFNSPKLHSNVPKQYYQKKLHVYFLCRNGKMCFIHSQTCTYQGWIQRLKKGGAHIKWV